MAGYRAFQTPYEGTNLVLALPFCKYTTELKAVQAWKLQVL